MNIVRNLMLVMLTTWTVLAGCSANHPTARLANAMDQYKQSEETRQSDVKGHVLWSRQAPDEVTVILLHPLSMTDDEFVGHLEHERETSHIVTALYEHFVQLREQSGYSQQSARHCEATICDESGRKISNVNHLANPRTPNAVTL